MTIKTLALATLNTLDSTHAASDALARLDSLHDVCDVCGGKAGSHTLDCGVAMRARHENDARWSDMPRDANEGAPLWFLT